MHNHENSTKNNNHEHSSKMHSYDLFFGFSVYAWCRYAAFLHLILCIVFIILACELQVNNIQMQTTKQIGVWMMANSTGPAANTTALSQVLNLNTCPVANATNSYRTQFVVQQFILQGPGLIDTRVLIILFHFLSFAFQYAESWNRVEYYAVLQDGHVSISHFIEYSLSASLMIIAMCAQLGITDVFLIASIAANCSGCMLFGALAELLFNRDDTISVKRFGIDVFHTYWIAHFAGWMLLLFALAGVVSNTLTITYCGAANSPAQIPSWVVAVVWSEVGLFCIFGFVQLLSFIKRKEPKQSVKWAFYTEWAYVVLSVTAKTTLGFGIIIGNFVNSSS